MAHTDFTADDGYKFHMGEYFKVIYDALIIDIIKWLF